MGLRNILAHVYFEVDEQQIYNICKDDVPLRIETVRQMLQD
ncbi:MAG: HepT-like ribonuclease domain-containing protein [Nodosilinea sp.]